MPPLPIFIRANVQPGEELCVRDFVAMHLNTASNQCGQRARNMKLHPVQRFQVAALCQLIEHERQIFYRNCLGKFIGPKVLVHTQDLAFGEVKVAQDLCGRDGSGKELA